MRVAVVGAGRIGCGFLVPALQRGGHDVTLVGRDPAVVRALRRPGGWAVRAVSAGGRVRDTDTACRVVGCHERGAAAALAGSEVALLAVGTGDLPGVLPLLRDALAQAGPLRDVVVVENQVDPAAALRRALVPAAPRCGVSSGLVTRVVARREGDPRSDRLRFVGDDLGALLVDGRGLRGPLPAATAIRAVTDHQDAVRRKLYTFNAGHAAAAYLGALLGYHYVHSAVADPAVARVVRGAVEEAVTGLAGAGPARPDADDLVTEHLGRFALPLDDTVERVGRDPLRKLGAHDRLVAPARLALAAGRTPACLALTCAAALRFAQRTGASGADPRARTAGGDLRAVFAAVSGEDPRGPLPGLVAGSLAALADPLLPPGHLPGTGGVADRRAAS